jgi:hypothetical protein
MSRPSPSRRDLLRYGLGAAAAGFLLPSRRLLADDDVVTGTIPGAGRAKQVVFLYMNGGASQLETFDPKPGTTNGGPTRTVPTSITGVHFADSLPMLAARASHLCVVRGMTSAEGNHQRARYLMHAGYAPNPTVEHASFGSILAKERGVPDADVPAYVSVGGPGAGPGYLGVAHGPFVVQDAARPLANVDLPAGVTRDRRDARLALLDSMNARFGADRGQGIPVAQRTMYERARRLMDSRHLEAFDLERASNTERERYGDTVFGRNTLLARRLLDIEVPCVEVMMNGWDTHDDNFNRVVALNADLDRAMSALLDDLDAEGRLDHTLVVWLGDFGRTPRITASEGRGHYPQAWSLVLAGGGVQGGRVVGRTDERGESVVGRPVSVPDLFASMAHATGIDGTTTTFLPNGRPIAYVDPEGEVVRELFA